MTDGAADSSQHRVEIHASCEAVWRALTDVDAMKVWMGTEEMRLEVLTRWEEGGPILLRGVHTLPFENSGQVLRFEPAARLCYTHRSSFSDLPDEPSSYTTFDFALRETECGCELTLLLSGFPTYTIRKHLDFYWRGTLSVLREFVEARQRSSFSDGVL